MKKRHCFILGGMGAFIAASFAQNIFAGMALVITGAVWMALGLFVTEPGE